MQRFHNLKIRTKLLAAFSTILVLTIFVGVFGMAQLTHAFEEWLSSPDKVRELAAADHNEAAAGILFSPQNIALETEIDTVSAALLQVKQEGVATVVREAAAAGARSKQLTVGVVL